MQIHPEVPPWTHWLNPNTSEFVSTNPRSGLMLFCRRTTEQDEPDLNCTPKQTGPHSLNSRPVLYTHPELVGEPGHGSARPTPRPHISALVPLTYVSPSTPASFKVKSTNSRRDKRPSALLGHKGFVFGKIQSARGLRSRQRSRLIGGLSG